MEATITKWGNSLGLRISKNICKDLNLSTGTKVTLKIKNNKLEIIPDKSKAAELEHLLSQINDNNLHPEFYSGGKTGNELW